MLELFFLLPFESGFRLIDGDQLNKLVAAVNGLTTQGAVTMKQMRQELVNISPATLYAVDNAVEGDIADPTNIQWTSGSVVVQGSELALLIQATLGYTDQQMKALFNSARRLVP